jgi:cytochrome b involved in lipid metabolism
MKKIVSLVSLFALVLILSACTKTQDNVTPAANDTATGAVNSASVYNLSEVAKHNKAADCWTIISGQVYDITAYVESGQHPGGPNVADSCGIDATALFDKIKKHSSAFTDQVLAEYLLGPEQK